MFIVDNRLDQNAASQLRGEKEDVQKTVISQGPLVNCRNPGGALMSRIRAARIGQTVYRPPGSAMQPPAASMQALPPALPASGPAAPGAAPGPVPGPCAGAPPMLALAAAPPTAAPPPGAAPPPAGGGPPVGGTAMASVDDSRLNEEAMKAIQLLNM